MIKKKYCIFLSEDLFYFNSVSVDPDEMQQYAAIHQGLHCLYPFTIFPYTTG